MFKYVVGIGFCLLMLVILMQGCEGFGERFRKAIDDRREKRQERWDDWREQRDQRWERGDDKDFGFGHRFRQRRQDRTEPTNDF